MTFLDLRKYRLRPGEALRDEQEIEIAPVELGGQRYIAVPELVQAGLTVTRASTGTVYELRYHARLHGPCFRCLGDAVLDEDLHLREYQAENPGGVEELMNPYVVDNRLDLNREPHEHANDQTDSRWAALAELRDQL